MTMDTAVNLVRLHLLRPGSDVITFFLFDIVRIAKIPQIFIQAISRHFAKFNGRQNFLVYSSLCRIKPKGRCLKTEGLHKPYSVHCNTTGIRIS